MDPELELDHVGIVVADLDAAQATFTKLGFQVTERSYHQGSPKAGDPVQPMGSANHCAMFEQGYLEIMGIWNPDLWSTAAEMLAHYEGLHIIASRNYDAVATHAALSSRLPGLPAPRILRREIEVDGKTETLEFHNIVTERAAMPEARFIVIEHKTPDLLWRPEQMAHPNGVVAIDDAYLCPSDFSEAVARIARLFDLSPELPEAGLARFQLARSQLSVYDDSAFARAYPGIRPPMRPSSMGCAFRVRDLKATRKVFQANGVAFNEASGGIWVGPPVSHGTVLSFHE
ncbi:MAG: VOC family protein [Alphaproteobacteria bacterium]